MPKSKTTIKIHKLFKAVVSTHNKRDGKTPYSHTTTHMVIQKQKKKEQKKKSKKKKKGSFQNGDDLMNQRYHC